MRIYLAGPMSGLPDYNFPEFNRWAALLRDQGYEVVNPAEMDGGDTSRPREYYMRRDLPHLFAVNAIYLLPGWRMSRGVHTELTVARAIGLPAVEAATGQVYTPEEIDDALRAWWEGME